MNNFDDFNDLNGWHIIRTQGLFIIRKDAFTMYIRNGTIIICWERGFADINEIKGIVQSVYDFMAVVSTMDTSRLEDALNAIPIMYETPIDVMQTEGETFRYEEEYEGTVLVSSIQIDANFVLI